MLVASNPRALVNASIALSECPILQSSEPLELWAADLVSFSLSPSSTVDVCVGVGVWGVIKDVCVGVCGG